MSALNQRDAIFPLEEIINGWPIAFKNCPRIEIHIVFEVKSLRIEPDTFNNAATVI